MAVAKSARETFLRMAIGHINNSKAYVDRFLEMKDDDGLFLAMRHMDDAIEQIRDFARRNEVTIRDSMPT
ncbi:hypothetical protein SEA_NANOSMITE_8 [Mycobacterium phage Nanosmite]|nr:hypothetical protein SEA_NANOSMITE_8 [Mycobacterium phage Nanosmite]